MSKSKPCPSCRSNGRDLTGNHLFLMRDGKTWHCTRCKYTEKDGYGEIIEDMLTLNDVNGIPFKPIPQLKFTEEDCKHWGIKVLTDETTGEVSTACYPVIRQGQIIGYKGRDLQTQDKRKRFFKVAGDMGSPTDLFGMHVCRSGGKYIIVTEGEKDCVSAWKILKYKGKDYSVVGLQNGASAGSITENKAVYDFLNSFDIIVLCFDNDAAGHKAADSIVPLFEVGKVKTTFPPNTDTDVWDMYSKGQFNEFWKCLMSAKERRPDGIISGKDTWEIIKNRPRPLSIPYPWQKLNEFCYGIRTSELDTWTSGSGSGKTQIFRELKYHIFRATGLDWESYFGNLENPIRDAGIGVISLEEGIHEAVEGIMSVKMGMRLNLPDVRDKVSDDDMYQAWLETVGTNRFHFLDHFGSMNDEGIVSKIRYMARALNCKWIFLDHLSILVSEYASEGGERERIDSIMTKLKNLTQELECYIGLIVHLRKSSGKPFEEGEVPSLDDLRGSGAIKQLSNGVFAIARDQQHPDEQIRNTSSIHVLKNRFTGRTGPAGFLRFDHNTGRMIEVESLTEVEEVDF